MHYMTSHTIIVVTSYNVTEELVITCVITSLYNVIINGAKLLIKLKLPYVKINLYNIMS